MSERHEQLVALFEGAPRFVARLEAIDDQSLDELLDRATEVALTMPADEQIELIDAHPRIGAPPEMVSAHSFREQGYDRGPASEALAARLTRLNDEYEARFGFRFVIFVNGRSREEVAAIMAATLDTSRDAELRRALADIIAIARNRHARPQQEQRA